MADTRKLDLKLKRMRAIESGYRSEIKRAEDEHKHNLISREKLLKIKYKYEGKIKKTQPKIRRLQKLRNQMKSA